MKSYLKVSFICMLWTLLLAGFSSIKGQTILNGVISIDSTLSLTYSPYLVTGNVVVLQNATLTIEPGVVVKFNPTTQLLLRGNLVANGTQQDTILFTSDSSGFTTWAGIKIDDFASAKIECSYFRGRFAAALFDHNRYSGTDTIIKVTHCYLDSNYWVMDIADYNPDTKQYFNSCTFSNNISVTGYAVNSTFKNSIFCHNSVRSLNTPSKKAIIDSCTFYNNSPVVQYVIVTNSTFFNNDIAISWAQTELHNNNIYNNTLAIYAYNVSPNSVSMITNNRICNNGKNVELVYGADFNVLNNCWCLTDSAQIRATMHDFFAAPGLGIVNYTPFDTTCSFSTNIQNEIEPNSNLEIYPNPATNNLTLKLPSNISSAELRMFNTLGEVENVLKIVTQKTNIDISNLASGVHIIEISDGKNLIRKKFIREQNGR